MTIHWRGALLIALSIGSASATAKTQGHGKVSLAAKSSKRRATSPATVWIKPLISGWFQ
ncbi:hypothetical protein M5585_04190 [Serratia ureilytica]